MQCVYAVRADLHTSSRAGGIKRKATREAANWALRCRYIRNSGGRTSGIEWMGSKMKDSQKAGSGKEARTAAPKSGGIPRCDDGSRLRPGERIDDLQRNGLRILQDPARFCFGMDAVLLAAYVQMKKARRALDLGTGNGIVPILLSDRTDCPSLTGLEILPASVGLAARSVALNGLEDRITIVEGDIRCADRIFTPASFDFITCNPPYRAAGSGKVTGSASAAGTPGASSEKQFSGAVSRTVSGTAAGPRNALHPNAGFSVECHIERAHPAPAETRPGCGNADFEDYDPRAIARHEILCTFDDVVRAAASLLRPGGHFYLIHRPLRLAEIITKLCTSGLEPKRMRLVHPHAGQAPNMVLLDCVRGGASELRVEPPLIVYETDGTYTPELLQIYYGT